MKRHIAWIVALLLYSCQPGVHPVFATDYWNYNANDLVVKKSPWVDVRAYGVLTTNTGAQNTSAINAMFTAVASGSVIVFPAGTYTVTAGLVLEGKHNLTITGAGSAKNEGGTYLRVTGSGDNTATLLDISNCYSLTFNNIAFYGNSDSSSNKTGMGVYIHRGSGFTSAIDFNYCYFRAFLVGTQIGHTSVNESNNEGMVFKDCFWTGNTIAYRQYWPNSLLNAHYNCNYWTNGTAIWLGDSTTQTGSLNIYNGNWSTSSVTDIYFEKPAELHIYGGRAETSPTFISNSATFGSLLFAAITLDGVTIVNQTDNTLPVITSASAGISARNSRFGQYTEVRQFIETTVLGARSVFTGCFFNSMADFDNTIATYGQYSIYGGTGWDGASTYPLPDGVRGREYGVGSTSTIPAQWGPLFYLSGPGTITAISNPSPGQVIYMRCEDNTYTVQSNASILLKGAVDFVCGGQRDTLTLYYQRGNNRWIEVGRTQ
jgi:hypothetical protein